MNTSPANIHIYSKDSSSWLHTHLHTSFMYFFVLCSGKTWIRPTVWAKITCEKPYAWIGSLPIIYVWLLPYACQAESGYKQGAGMSSKYIHKCWLYYCGTLYWMGLFVGIFKCCLRALMQTDNREVHIILFLLIYDIWII